MVAAAKAPGKASTLMTFRVVPGARLAKRDASVIGDEFIRLRKTGALTRERVLDAASRSSNPLHKFFDWDDQSAAHQYRLTQAGYLLRSIEVVVQDTKGKDVPLKGFFNVDTKAGGRRWEPMQFVFDDQELSVQVIEDAYQQLEGWIARYKKYEWASEAAPLVADALQRIKKKR